MISTNDLIPDPMIQEPAVSDLSNDSPIPEEPIETPEPSSSGPMLITMALLIAALSLSGAMLFHYAAAQQGVAEGDVPGAEEKKGPGLEALAGLFKKKVTAAHTNTAQTVETLEPPKEEQKSSGFNLFGDRGDKVRWPKMKLTGFGTSTDGAGGFAIINDKQVHPGQLIDDKAKLVEVREHDVVVEYRGETKSLTVDIGN